MKADDWLEERVITGLRMDEGTVDARLDARFGHAAQRADCYMSPMVVGLHPSMKKAAGYRRD